MKTASFPSAAGAAILPLLCGCASTPRVVGESQLNWIAISYRPASAGLKPCRITLSGTGHIDFKEGLSPRIGNEFSQDVEHSQWQDVYQDKLNVPPDVIRGWLQIFVDAGIMDRKKRISGNRDGSARDTALISGKIHFDNIACVTDDEEILGHVRKLIGIVKDRTSGP